MSHIFCLNFNFICQTKKSFKKALIWYKKNEYLNYSSFEIKTARTSKDAILSSWERITTVIRAAKRSQELHSFAQSLEEVQWNHTCMKSAYKLSHKTLVNRNFVKFTSEFKAKVSKKSRNVKRFQEICATKNILFCLSTNCIIASSVIEWCA